MAVTTEKEAGCSKIFF